MKLFFGLVISLLSVSQTARAESMVLFSAQEQCNSRETGKGLRYIPPCNLAETEFTFTIPEDSGENNGDNIESGTNAQQLKLNFHCESLRPLSIEYQISRQENIIISGKLAPTPKNSQLTSSLSALQPADDYQLKLIKINGMKGFQAIKPDCRLTLEFGKKVEAELAAITE